MFSKVSTLIIACALLGLFSLTAAKEEATNYPLTPIATPLTTDEIQAALEYLGLKLERFSYEVPYKHSIHFTLQRFVKGKRKDVSGGGTFSLDAGQHSLILFIHQKDDEINFTVQTRNGGGGVRGGVGSVSIKGYHAQSSGPLENAQFIAGKKVPLFVFAGNSQSITGISSNETMDNIVSKYELVVAVTAELEDDRDSTKPRPMYQGK